MVPVLEARTDHSYLAESEQELTDRKRPLFFLTIINSRVFKSVRGKYYWARCSGLWEARRVTQAPERWMLPGGGAWHVGGGLSLCRSPPHRWWGGEGIFSFPSLTSIPQKLGLAPAACDGVWLCSPGQLRSWPLALNSRIIHGRKAQLNPQWGGAGHVSAEQTESGVLKVTSHPRHKHVTVVISWR